MAKNFLNTNGLMRYLRSKGIAINGSYQKRQLINYGYYHGYKGYRFFGSPSLKIPFSDYKQIIALIQYDNKLKSMFYPHLMFIETALKNITLEIILDEANSNEINEIFNKLMPGHLAAPAGANREAKAKLQKKKLSMQHRIQSSILQAYNKENNIISNFYNKIKYADIPAWAVFEIIPLGEFGSFVACLNQATRRKISQYIDLDLSGDTNTTLLQDSVFVIKDLRNAVAHNDVVFDTRFRKSAIQKPLQVCMTHDVKLPYANFKCIIDYVALVVYFLKKMKVNRNEILGFITSFERIVGDLQKEVPAQVFSMVVHADVNKKIAILRQFVKL